MEKLSIIPSWQQSIRTSIRTREALLKHLELPDNLIKHGHGAANLFRLFVPLSFVERMEKGNLNDPLLRQVLPLDEELQQPPAFSIDPLGEADVNPVKGLLHKYKGRLLLFPSTTCAINCRYCFRRNFPYENNRPDKKEWMQVISYIGENKDIKEVIYSGGDPLAISDHRLAWLTRQIESISHVERLRIHTRLPVVIPERIDQLLLNWLTNTRLKTVMVIHCNHANEVNDKVAGAINRLRECGITVLNQSVLLKGINDDVVSLINLSEVLFDNGVIPYYLHLLDRVQGAAHFEVSEERARRLVAGMSRQSPGYLVPRLVREEKGKPCKTIIAPLYD